MAYKLPALPYSFDALEPHIDGRTMEIHHGKHHAAYVDKLNKAIEGFPDFGEKSIEELLAGLEAIPEEIRPAVRNNGGGHYNHALYWTILSRDGGGCPDGELLDAINHAFGSFETLHDRFTAIALDLFGSGWAWLFLEPGTGKLDIGTTANHDSPVLEAKVPILTLDLWEHAYYLKYQNRRADYVAAWWNLVNWHEVGRRYVAARAVHTAEVSEESQVPVVPENPEQ